MKRFASRIRMFSGAAALGLLATAPLYLPPASIVARLDAWLFDIWSRLDAVPPTPGVAVATLETPALLADVLARAAEAGVELVITTFPEPLESTTVPIAGPTEISLDTERSQATRWSQGGHLVFSADVDGVVRRDVPLHRGGTERESLAFFAARKLLAASGVPSTDRIASSRWLRLPNPQSLPQLADSMTPARVIVAGPRGRSYMTPAGVASTPELVAQTLSSHLSSDYIARTLAASLTAWTVGLLLAASCAALVLNTWRTAVGIAVGVTALIALSAVAFIGMSQWLPIAGPAAWFAITSGLLLVQRRVPLAAPRTHELAPLAAARRAADTDKLTEAWALYRALPPAPALLPEMYDLACALATRGRDDEAADLFHRIAQVDSQFRDASQRLVRSTHVADNTTNDAAAHIPHSIGRYRLLEHIGRGAMGNVYLAHDPLINRIVALKAIDLSLGYDDAGLADTTESFLREARIAGALSHSSIVTIFDVGQAEGLAYIAMEYVRGHRLSDFVRDARLLPVTSVIDLVSRAADALDYAHRQNVVHRDIKPANIMYDSISNSLKITDFGIAKLIDANRTRTGIVLGTPAYMSPEQLEGRNVNGHTDLFALGVSLYQLLSGHLPFRGASMANLMFVIANERHDAVTSLRDDLPKWLDAVVDRALAKDPRDRFQTGAEMAAALRHAA